jgi:methylmalonyl-CoA/ethylmalonyl-CoA epimerase
MLQGLDHIGIAVDDLEQATKDWLAVTGGQFVHREVVAEQKVEISVIQVGSLRIELIRPTDSASPIAKFIAARGTGLHHLALLAQNAQAELNRLNASEFMLIDEIARTGAEQTQIGFLHPRALGGVLVEIVQRGG